MRFCKDCRWSQKLRNKALSPDYYEMKCLRPEVNQYNSSYLADNRLGSARDCWLARMDQVCAWRPWRLRPEACGADARYWEAREAAS